MEGGWREFKMSYDYDGANKTGTVIKHGVGGGGGGGQSDFGGRLISDSNSSELF